MQRSSFADRVGNANATANDTRLAVVWATIALVLLLVHTLAYVTAEFGMTKGENKYSQYTNSQMCLAALKNSDFDVQNTDAYHKWMDDSTALYLAETGIYQGPEEIKEYVDFVNADFFDFVKTRNIETVPIYLADDECTVLFVIAHKTQIKEKYQAKSGNKCYERVVGSSVTFDPREFKIKRINFYYSGHFLAELFGNALNSDGVRNFVCDVMETNCQETFQLNNLTTSTCRAKYDSLPSTNSEGYLDDNSKGCRILHSGFAAHNPKHCPHLSFVPQEDWLGRIKCQKSKGMKPTDILSTYELDTVKSQGYEWGFDESLTKACEYDPHFEFEEPNFGKTHSFAQTVPSENLNDYQFLVYAGFVMYVTMVSAGLGGEYLVWKIMLSGDWDEQREWYWKAAQFIFPILGATTVGLANTGNYLALPFLVITMWKLGFPETMLLFYAALYEPQHPWQERLVDFIRGMGTIVHHSSSALYVAMLVTHVLPSNRDVVAVTLPLLMQHWVVLLKYTHKTLYIVCEVIIEAWWEWTAFSVLPAIHELHWVGGVIILSMLFAHWCYFGAGIFVMIAAGRKTDDNSNELSIMDQRGDTMFPDNLGRLRLLRDETTINTI